MKIQSLLTMAVTAAAVTTTAHADVIIDFSDLSLDAESFYNGSDEAGGFTSNGVHFNNSYNSDWGSWSGFAYSNVSDTNTAGFGNQYAAYTGEARNGDIYAIGYTSTATVSLPIATTVSGAYFTNTTYTGLSMLDGDMFAKQFEPGDWFRLSIIGLDAAGQEVGTVDFYLADFTSPYEEDHYILDTWEWVNLSTLGEVSELTFAFASSDVGDFGMNTPAYFAMDSLTVAAIPEPGTFALLAIGSLLAMRHRRR